MTATVTPPVIVQGSDKELTYRLVKSSNGEPFPIGDATEIVTRHLNADGTTLDLKLSEDEIEIVSGDAGKFISILTAAQTALLAVTDSSGLLTGVEILITIGGKVTIINQTEAIDVQAPLFAAE